MKVYKIEKNCTECSNFYQVDSCCECDAGKHFSEQIDANVVSIIL